MSSIAPIPPINLGNIQNIGSASGAKSAAGAVGAVENASNSFESMLNSLNKSQQSADTLLQQLSLGENVDLHQVMIGMEENDVNFRVALAMRDKLVEAYREMMRMQI